MEIDEMELHSLGWNPYFQSQLDPEEMDKVQPVRVIALHRNYLDILGTSGESKIPISGKFRDILITVGDWLLLDENERVQRLLDRKTIFKRRAAGTGREKQLIASNVDTLFIVTSCNQDFNVARLERYLVLAEEAGVLPVIVLTKIDECDDPNDFRSRAEAIRRGVLVVLVNSLDSNSVADLSCWCNEGQTVALVGSSGVGKSTIINTLTGKTELKTAGIRQDDDKGRHTTTGRALYRLNAGGWLLDTPGMREIQLVDVHDGILSVFDDIVALANQCRFNDCKHENEPGCAVQAAIQTGDLEPARLARYRKLEAEERRNSETLAERRSKERAFGLRVNNAKQAKRKREE